MEEDAGVNRTGEFAETTEKETENKNIYTNIPLTMHESEKNGDNEDCWDEANFFSDFSIKPATKDKFFKDRCENNKWDEGKNAIQTDQVTWEANILGLIDLKPGEVFE